MLIFLSQIDTIYATQMSMHTVYVCDNEYEYRENERQKDHACNLKLLFKKKGSQL